MASAFDNPAILRGLADKFPFGFYVVDPDRTILYWNEATSKPVASVAVDFGRHVWNKALDDPARFDAMTKGKVWRLGNDYWTILDTNLPLRIGERNISVGLWYLGLHRSDDGSTWSLAFIDPVKARRNRNDGFVMEEVPVEFRVPMKPEQTAQALKTLSAPSQQVIEKLSQLNHLPADEWRFHAGDVEHGEAVDLDETIIGSNCDVHGRAPFLLGAIGGARA